jgi:hypothetical protein
MKALAELASQDTYQRGLEFCRVVRHYGAAKGLVTEALELATGSNAPSRVISTLTDAVSAGSVGLGSPSPWGSELVGYQQLVGGFYEALRSRSVFFSLLQAGAIGRVPLRTQFNRHSPDEMMKAMDRLISRWRASLPWTGGPRKRSRSHARPAQSGRSISGPDQTPALMRDRREPGRRACHRPRSGGGLLI